MGKLIINGRFLSQRMTGVHRYAYEMTCALKRQGVDLLVVAPKHIENSYQISFPIVQIGLSSSHFWEQTTLPIYVRNNFPKSYILSFTGLCPLLYKNNISTIHDMSFMANPKWFTRSYYLFYKLLTPIMAKKSKKIITVSNFSKHELVKYLHIDEQKIIVVYNAVSETIIGEKSNDTEQYILAVSSLDPRKNLYRLVEAFNEAKLDNLKLYIVGATHPSFRKGGVPQTDNPNISYLGYVSGRELAKLYRNAFIAVYPSLYEGFGLPNIEAMINSCPIITSDIEPHREVCKDGVLYFNPQDTKDLTKVLTTAYKDEELRNNLIKRAEKIVQIYNWDKSAKTLLNYIEQK